jgi:hypothetical protein
LFKLAETDGIVPALLHHGVQHLDPYLYHMFGACMIYGYIPKAWKQTRLMFIPKAGKTSYTVAKAYYLSSFLLEVGEISK